MNRDQTIKRVNQLGDAIGKTRRRVYALQARRDLLEELENDCEGTLHYTKAFKRGHLEQYLSVRRLLTRKLDATLSELQSAMDSVNRMQAEQDRLYWGPHKDPSA